jgi:hypothetical protein
MSEDNKQQSTKEIPQFSSDDFMLTTKPYDYIYSFHENKFQFWQMIGRISTLAKQLKVSGFKKMWEEYLKSVTSSSSNMFIENTINFDGQDELVSGDYSGSEVDGITYRDRNDIIVTVCCHPIIPIERLVNIDTNTYKLKIAYKRGKTWKTVIADKSTLSSATKIIDLSDVGIAVTSMNAKLIGEYLMKIEELNYERIPEQQSVGRLGWISENKFSPYVKDLVFDGDMSFSHIFEAIKEKGNYDIWLNIMREVRQEKNIYGKLFLATSFSSAILEPCGLLPFFLHAWGSSEVGKTVGLMLSASVWGNPTMGEYITTFNGTAVGQELQASFLNSLPMCIDELQIKSSQRISDFDAMIYQLTEGVGRLRGKKTGGLQKTTTWRNCFITTGEHPISNSSSGGGAVNRVIEFECTEKVYSDLVELCKVIKLNYGFAGKMFVEYLQQDGIIEKIRNIQQNFYKELLKTNSTDKQAASASAILTADKIATEIIFKDDKALSVDDMKLILSSKDNVNANKRALNYIYDTVAVNSSKFWTSNMNDSINSEVWGMIDDQYIYIINSVFEKLMLEQGYNSAAFLSWAKRESILKCNSGRNTLRKRIGAVSPRCVVLCKQTLYEDSNEDDETDCEYSDLPF